MFVTINYLVFCCEVTGGMDTLWSDAFLLWWERTCVKVSCRRSCVMSWHLVMPPFPCDSAFCAVLRGHFGSACLCESQPVVYIYILPVGVTFCSIWSLNVFSPHPFVFVVISYFVSLSLSISYHFIPVLLPSIITFNLYMYSPFPHNYRFTLFGLGGMNPRLSEIFNCLLRLVL